MSDEYSPARYLATKYTVYPTGFDEAPFSDKIHFCVYVERFSDTGRWKVYDGYNLGRILTRKGNWVRDVPLNRQWTRWDNVEDALDAALKAVDTAFGRDIIQESARFLQWKKDNG